MNKFQDIANGGVASAQGFKACGVAAGIKYPGRMDVAMVAADKPCAVAGMFTTNKVAAAPVVLDRSRVKAGVARAVLINSGCANACTGEQGLADAKESARVVASAMDVPQEQVFVCSTGVIGAHLPMDRMAAGAKAAVAALSSTGGADAARAIMTTDTVSKEAALALEIDARRVVIGGMCKGAGMIEPNMATLLAFVTTDADIGPAALDAALRPAVETTFNRVVVDGDQSTNDTVIMMASGVAGNAPLTPTHPQWSDFCAAVREVCDRLARMIAMDGEGVTKFVTVRVTGAATERDAQRAARAIAKSPLVKTSWFGRDLNFGRVICAAGYSGADVDDQKARIFYGPVCVYDCGQAVVVDRDAAKKVMEARAFDVTLDLGLGDGEDTVYTCDLSYDYVKINGDYTT
jgi:glutamate N-acetyltransferase/amino-acid N-acetyltransferase